MMTRRRWGYVVGGLALLLLIIQVIPVAPADNPPVEQEVVVPSEVGQVLRASCYDCHSFETTWPWYAYVAPVKWLVRDHVVEGREHLNFTAWNRYDPDRARHKWEEVAEQVEEGHMPIRSYLILHPDAALTDANRELLVSWANSQAGEEGAGAEGEARPAEDPDS